MADRKLSITITGDATKAKAALRDLDSSLGKTEGSAKKSSSGIKSALAGIGLTAGLYGAAKAWDESAKVAAQSAAVIKSTGGAANVTANEMSDLATSISKKTYVDDEAIQSGENLIATFTGIRNEAGKGNDIFNQTTLAAVDMAAALGKEVPEAAQMLGKALNDPAAGLSKLTRAGVVFTDQQKDQIKALSASGDKIGAQKIILAELTKEFGGSAAAQATSMDKAKLSAENFAESVGSVLAPAMDLAAKGAAGAGTFFESLAPPLKTAAVAATAVAVVAPKVAEGFSSLKDTATSVKSFATGLDLAKVSSLALAGVAGGAAAAALWVINDGMVRGAKAAAKYEEGVADLAASMTDGLSPSEALGKRLKDVWTHEADQAMNAGIGSVSELRDLALMSDKDFKQWSKGMQGFDANFLWVKVFRDEMADATKQVRNADEASKDLAKSQGDGASKTDKLVQAQADAVIVFSKGAIAAHDQATELGEIKKESDAAREAISDYYDEITGQLDKSVAVEQAYDDLTKSLIENGKTFDKGKQEGRNNIKALEDYRNAAVAVAQAERERTGTSQAGIDSLRASADRFADLADKAGYSDKQIAEMQYTMGLTKPQIETTFKTNATQTEIAFGKLVEKQKEIQERANLAVMVSVSGLERLALAAQLVAAIGGRTTAQAAVDTVVGTASAGAGGLVAGRASGGSVRAGVPYLVGERGPELRTFGSNGHITPAAQTRALLSGASGGSVSGAMAGGNVYVTVQVAGSVRADRDLAATIRSELTKAAKNRPGQGRFIATSGLGPTL